MVGIIPSRSGGHWGPTEGPSATRTDDVRMSPGHALLLAFISRAGPRGLTLDVPASSVVLRISSVYVYRTCAQLLPTYCLHIRLHIRNLYTLTYTATIYASMKKGRGAGGDRRSPEPHIIIKAVEVNGPARAARRGPQGHARPDRAIAPSDNPTPNGDAPRARSAPVAGGAIPPAGSPLCPSTGSTPTALTRRGGRRGHTPLRLPPAFTPTCGTVSNP